MFLWLGWYIAISMTLLTLGGHWLDLRFETSPGFLLGGMILSIILIALELKRHWKTITG